MISIGCATAPNRLEMDYGTSFKLARFNQILNPEAERNLAPATGFDARAAQAAMQNYYKDFEGPEPPTIYNFNIGAIGK
jgi:hypothetical protein